VSERSEALLVVAGEASGDTHAADLLTELAQRRPALSAFGLGGERLDAAGLERVAASSEISVVGITEVWKILPRARQIFRQLLEEVDRREARTALLVDFPDFNLRLARELKKRGVRVVYYVSPQVWAWRQSRVKTIARVVDRMLVLFGFEAEFYRHHGIEAIHVGHPVVDQVPEIARRCSPQPLGRRRLCLLPGSRPSEIRALLPVLGAAARSMALAGDLDFCWILADGIDPEEYRGLLPSDLRLEVVREGRFEAIADCDLALCASGTATLEVGLLGTPMIVVYKVSRLTWWIGRALVRSPNISLVNLVFGRTVVPELLQGRATASGIARKAHELLGDPERLETISRDLATLREQLGVSGASGRAAEVVATEMAKERVETP
jgi:lipid-A-disaccharide synthase